MSKLDLHTAVAFGRLRLPELVPVLEHIEKLRAETLEGMVHIDQSDQWRRMQGRAHAFQELLNLVYSSDETAAKLSRPRQ